jgi:hypothetical protein
VLKNTSVEIWGGKKRRRGSFHSLRLPNHAHQKLGLGFGTSSLLRGRLLSCSLLGSSLLGRSGLLHCRLDGGLLGLGCCGFIGLGGGGGLGLGCGSLLSRTLAPGRRRDLLGLGSSGLGGGGLGLGGCLLDILSRGLGARRGFAARGRALFGGVLGSRGLGARRSLRLRLLSNRELVRGFVLHQTTSLNTSLQSESELHLKNILVHAGVATFDELVDSCN